MIRVKRRRAPPGFQAAVRTPGQAWLAANPYRKGEELPPFWRNGLPDLRREYKAICAYLGCFVQSASAIDTVDHFVAKRGLGRKEAYSWGNFRFACARMNARKGVRAVIDPFTLQDGWFELVFLSIAVFVRAAPHLRQDQREAVDRAIDRLRLNDDKCVEERTTYWADYQNGDIAFDYLKRFCPFVALEAARQGRLLAKDSATTPAQIRAWLDS